MDGTEEDTWTVGALAGAAGVTARTLHHYDRIGLLEPSDRSFGGHRRYSEEDVARLYRILSLKSLGFALGEVAELLEADRGSLLAATRERLSAVGAEIEEAERLRARLERIVAAAESEAGPSAEQLIDAMEAMSMNVRLSKIYTRSGDAGVTRLADGSAVRKTHEAVRAVGDVDELNAHIGLAIAEGGLSEEEAELLGRVQNDLFDIGSRMSRGPADEPPDPVSDEKVAWLEEACDEANAGLEPLDSFVLPGGTPASARLHVCRTVCRRAERNAVAVEGAPAKSLAYLNRLSDLLFILARRHGGGDERLWEPSRP